jgi:hypothetical protein
VTTKAVSKMFNEQFWQELQASHRAAIERSRFDRLLAEQDASVVQWSSETIQPKQTNQESK